MKIKLNELRTLIRKVAAMQIAEAATKRKPVAKSTKKISVNEIRSMIKEAILKEAKQTRELKTTEQVKKNVVDEINRKYPTFVKLFNEKKLGFSLEDLIDKLYSPIENKEDIKQVSSEFPSLQFLSVKALKDSLRKWIPGSERLETSSVVDTEETEKRPEPVYQTGEETLQKIADVLDVTKQMAEKIEAAAMEKLSQMTSLAPIFKGKSREKISAILKAVRKGKVNLKNPEDFNKAIAEVHNVLIKIIDEEIEKFITELLNNLDIKLADVSPEDFTKLSLEEINNIKLAMNVEDLNEAERQFITDYLRGEITEENAITHLKDLFFKYDPEKLDMPFPNIAKAVHEKVRPEIVAIFNPETRGRGEADQEVLASIRDYIRESIKKELRKR